MTILVAAIALSAGAWAVPFTDLGYALYANGYTGSIWVNSLDPQGIYLAHGDFHPSISGADYLSRFGMRVSPASGTVANTAGGGSDANGTATNTSSFSSDGSIVVELAQNGTVVEQVFLSFVGCPAFQSCPWSTHFSTTLTGPGWTVAVRRNVKGSRCGGELNFDFNGSCHDTLVSFFNLPPNYVFTSQDLTDSNYASKPQATTTALCATIKPLCDVVPSPTPASNFTWQPAAILPGDLVSFTDTSSDTPSAWSWSFQDGSPSSATTANPQVRFSSPGQKTVTLTASNASGAGSLATKVLTVIDPNPGGGQLVFTVSPPAPAASQVVTFDASSSTFVPTGSTYDWNFADGSPDASGVTALHAFAQPGSYDVTLSISPPGCVNASCLLSTAKVVTVSAPSPPVSADFTTDASCQSSGSDPCQAAAGSAVIFTASETAASYSWNFGDGKPLGSGKVASHVWTNPGSFTVTLTVTKGAETATKSRTFVVVGPPNKTVVIPSVFDGAAPLLQWNDIYVYNPGAAPLGVTLEFRRRGTPDVNPPRRTVAIPPHATAYLPDALSLFGSVGQSGFVNVIADSTTVAPIATALDGTARTAGKSFALSVPGKLIPPGLAAPLGGSVQHLVGLNDTADRQSSLGVNNPTGQSATYHLRFFDSSGNALGESADLSLAPYAQAQFGVLALRNRFGVTSKADYRVAIEGIAGPPVFPFVSDVRVATGDISLAVPQPHPTSKTYLLGVASGAGLAGRALVTDLLLANVGDASSTTTLALTKPGKPRVVAPTPVAVLPGQTKRLQNVLLSQFGQATATGVLTLSGAPPGTNLPAVLAESFDNSNPARRYGQALVPQTDADAATAGTLSVLTGLRQDAAYSTTLWLFNPGAVAAKYDLVYRRIDGTVLGTLANVALPAGAVRQFDPAQHPIKKPYPVGGFTLEVVVKSGSALTAAQVVNLATHDPAWVAGVKR